MRLDEMKLAVCEKLPECIDIHRIAKEERGDPKQGDLYLYYWNNEQNRQLINWPTEGLQVCHEAEKYLLKAQQWAGEEMTHPEYGIWTGYIMKLKEVCDKGYGATQHATYEQRLEALCRVWYPERFN